MHVMRMRADDQRVLTLQRAVLIYAADDPMRVGLTEGAAAATINPVTCGEIGPGELIAEATMAHMMRLVGGQSAVREVLPPHVLYAGGDAMLWFAPSKRAVIWFKTTDRPGLNALSGQTVAHAALLFLARPGRLSVWALKDSSRPGPSTPLFVAPYFNIYQSGAMCEGNVALPKVLSVGEIAAWERAFYQTEFTHSNGMDLCRHPRGHDGLWKEMASPKVRIFPAQYLLPALDDGDENGQRRMPLTVEGVLNR